MKIPFRGEMPTIIEFASENPHGQRDRGKHWVNDQRVEGGGYWRKNRGGSGVEGTGGKRRVGTVKEGKEVDSAADLLESLGGPDEDFGGEEPGGGEAVAPEVKETENMTSDEAIAAGVGYGDWAASVQDAYVNERIEEDADSWESLKDTEQADFDGVTLIGKKVINTTTRDMPYGEVVSAFPRGVVVKHPDGTTSKQSAAVVQRLDAWVEHRTHKEKDVPSELSEYLAAKDTGFKGEAPESEYTPDVGNGADADTGDEKMDTHLTAAIKKNEMVVLQVGERGKIAYIPKSHKLFNRVVARYSDLSQDDVHGAVVAEYMEKHDEALSVSDYIINPPTVDGYAPKYRATKVRAGGNGEPDIDFLTREGGAVWKTFKWVGMSRREGRRMMGLSLNDA